MNLYIKNDKQAVMSMPVNNNEPNQAFLLITLNRSLI